MRIRANRNQNVVESSAQTKGTSISVKMHAQNQQIKNMKEILQNVSASKPTNAEAQRIVTILDNLVDKLEILSYVDKEFVANFSNPAASNLDKNLLTQLSKETIEALQEQARLEKEFCEMNLNAQGKPHDTENQSLVERSESVQNQLEKASRNLTRILKRNTQDFETIKMLRGKTIDDYGDYLVCMKSLRAIYLKRLSTAAEEDASQLKQLSELRERTEGLEGTKKIREGEREALRKNRVQTLNEKNEEIDKLKSQKKMHDDLHSQNMKRIDEDRLKRKEGIDKSFTDILSKEKEQRDKVKEALAKIMEANAKREQELKREIGNKEEMLKDTFNDYDRIMREKTTELAEIEAEFNTVRNELDNKKEYFQGVEEEKAREAKMDTEWEEKKKKFEREQNHKIQAGAYIIGAYRFWKLSKKKKPKKGGKKKKQD